MRIEPLRSEIKIAQNKVNEKQIKEDQEQISPSTISPSAKKITKSLDECIAVIENTQTNSVEYNGVIMRDTEDHLIISDEIYEALANYTGSDPIEFAKTIVSDGDEEKVNYYAAMFMLIEQEGGLDYCHITSDFGENADILQEMINCGKITLDNVFVKNSQIKDSNSVNNNKDYYYFSDYEYSKLESEISEITNGLLITSEDDYDNIKTKFEDFEERVYQIYCKALTFFPQKNDISKAILSDAENRYNELMTKIEQEFKRIQHTYRRELPNNNPQKTLFGTLLLRQKEL